MMRNKNIILIITAAVGITGWVLGCGSEDIATAPQSKPTHRTLPTAKNERTAAGQQIVQNVCASCHLPGLAGAPKIGDINAWSPRLEKGMDTLLNHAINGFEAPSGNIMPPRGGELSLTDDEIKQAVEYLIEAHQE